MAPSAVSRRSSARAASAERASAVGNRVDSRGEPAVAHGLAGLPALRRELGLATGEDADCLRAAVRQIAQGRYRVEQRAERVVLRNSVRLFRAGAIRRVESDETRPGHKQLDLAPVTIDGGAYGVRPSEQLRTGAIAAFGGQRLRNVDDGVGVERKFRQLRGQARRSSRIRLEHDGKRVERLVQLLRSDGVSAQVAGERGERLASERDRVFNPGPP